MVWKYEPYLADTSGDPTHGDLEQARMREADDGEYVLASEYDLLVSEHERTEAELAKFKVSLEYAHGALTYHGHDELGECDCQIAKLLRGTAETPEKHSTEDDFQHFLSYSGLGASYQRLGRDVIDLRVAYYTGAGIDVTEPCSACAGTGEIDETLGGISTSDPHAPCPDCTPKTDGK